MRSRPLLILLLLLFPALALAGPYYVRGDFYCHPGETGTSPTDDCWGYDAGNEMFDDGLHDDGAANDGIWGASVVSDQPAGRHEWKIALPDWSENFPNSPINSIANAVLFTSGPGDVVHFRFDRNFLLDGWQPLYDAVQCDHALPPGTELEVIGSAPELGNWISGVPLTHAGRGYQHFVTIATPGTYEFKLRVAGTWDVAAFGYDYNNTSGRNAIITTTYANSDVLFQLDEQLGRVRGIELGPVPVQRKTWGQLKSLFR